MYYVANVAGSFALMRQAINFISNLTIAVPTISTLLFVELQLKLKLALNERKVIDRMKSNPKINRLIKSSLPMGNEVVFLRVVI